MENYMDDFESYKRYTSQLKCPCGCPAHCGHSCTECDNCSDCECNECVKGQGNN